MRLPKFVRTALFSTIALIGVTPCVLAAEVVTADDLQWTPLNPLRGDASPQAATLWGDRSGKVATGFLVRFRKSFSSPPHIHNVTYRGIVISGLVHNDDPGAAKMWMPAGSYWTQPAGEVHITAANADENIAYIEIGSGPYLVRPPAENFDNGERPVNVDPTNLVWLELPDANNEAPVAKRTYLWGSFTNNSLNGTMLKLPRGYTGELLSLGRSLRAIVISGRLRHRLPKQSAEATLSAGSYFSTTGTRPHRIACDAEASCLIYLRSFGRYDLQSTK